MSLKVKDVIRELKKFPNDFKVSLETYNESKDNEGGYDKTNCIAVDKDEDAENFVVIKQLEPCSLKIGGVFEYLT